MSTPRTPGTDVWVEKPGDNALVKGLKERNKELEDQLREAVSELHHLQLDASLPPEDVNDLKDRLAAKEDLLNQHEKDMQKAIMMIMLARGGNLRSMCPGCDRLACSPRATRHELEYCGPRIVNMLNEINHSEELT